MIVDIDLKHENLQNGDILAFEVKNKKRKGA